MDSYLNALPAMVALPLALLTITFVISVFQPGIKPFRIIKLSYTSSVVNIIVSLACVVLVYTYGPVNSPTIGIFDLGFSILMDQLSVLIYFMIALLSFVIIKFSYNYLDGEDRHGLFIGRLAATIAAVQLLVLSDNLFQLFMMWVITSMALHSLLLFYPHRPKAIIAARKKFIMARISDGFLLIAVFILYSYFGSGNLQVIFNGIKHISVSSLPAELELAAICIAMAALLKSAQFPTHGWLIEVMETPTPVSALLHAGLLNAGPFLIIRMAFLISASSNAPVILIIVGGITAFFASTVFMTQGSIKTALAYSSVAHMGFSLMICGIGIYPAALLHLVAHSFYKAHAFLSSGSSVEVVRSMRQINPPIRYRSPLRICIGMIMGIAMYCMCAMLWNIDPTKDFGLFATGLIIVMGLIQLLIPTIDSNRNTGSTLRIFILAILVVIAFFTLENFANQLLRPLLPDFLNVGVSKIIFTTIILLLFGLAVFMQLVSFESRLGHVWQSIPVHFRHGWYTNILFDRMVGALKIDNQKERHAVPQKNKF